MRNTLTPALRVPVQRIAVCLSEIGVNPKRSDEIVVANKNKHEKCNHDDLVLESMTVKKIPVPVMSDIHEFIGESN